MTQFVYSGTKCGFFISKWNLSSLWEGIFTKPKYKKPTAIPLGEALKGSGQCNAGSAVMPRSGGCYPGTSPDIYKCTAGNNPGQAYSTGTQPTHYIIK